MRYLRFALLGSLAAFGVVAALAAGVVPPRVSQETTGPSMVEEAAARSVIVHGGEVWLGWGSGAVIGPHYVLTSRHVLERLPGGVFVRTADGTDLPAVRVWTDAADIAVLRVNAPLTGAARVSCRSPVPGEQVMVMGSPMIAAHPAIGVWRLPAWGHVLAAAIEETVLTTAVMLPGHSGGAVYDAQGNVIGVVRYLLQIALGPFSSSPSGVTGFVALAGVCASLERAGYIRR